MPSAMNLSGLSMGISTTSLIFSICSLQPPTSAYVTSGFSSTVIMVTLGSILGGSGICICILFWRSTPHLMPSSMSVADTRSPRPTTYLAICRTLMTYLASSWPALMIFVQRATCSGCSLCMSCLSAMRSQVLGGARPVSLSLMPFRLLMSFVSLAMSSSVDLMLPA
jgi:hypothetical protein